MSRRRGGAVPALPRRDGTGARLGPVRPLRARCDLATPASGTKRVDFFAWASAMWSFGSGTCGFQASPPERRVLAFLRCKIAHEPVVPDAFRVRFDSVRLEKYRLPAGPVIPCRAPGGYG
jgi:hypothetical protein